MIPACFVKRYAAEANPHRQREIRSHNGTIPLMGAIVPRNLGYYSCARTGYANLHAGGNRLTLRTFAQKERATRGGSGIGWERKW
jgi:hypothetical protein